MAHFSAPQHLSNMVKYKPTDTFLFDQSMDDNALDICWSLKTEQEQWVTENSFIWLLYKTNYSYIKVWTKF